METIQSLMGVLRDQISILEDLKMLIEQEKVYITSWNIDKVIETAKSKDTIVYKERILDEAKDKYIKKYCLENGISSFTIGDVIDTLKDKEQQAQILALLEKLRSLAVDVRNGNMAVKILYGTNLRLISDFFDKIGLNSNVLYNQKGTEIKKTVSINRSA